MEGEIKKLTATIAAMATKMTNNENRDPNSGTSGGGSSNHVSRQPQIKKIRNMGTYCSFHGFNPVGTNHDSVTCRNEWMKPKHNIAATWTNRLGGDRFWPSAKQVAIATRSSHMEGKVSPHQLTGTGECFEQKER